MSDNAKRTAKIVGRKRRILFFIRKPQKVMKIGFSLLIIFFIKITVMTLKQFKAYLPVFAVGFCNVC